MRTFILLVLRVARAAWLYAGARVIDQQIRVRSFAGTVIPAGENAGQAPQVDAKLGTGNTKTLKITLTN